MKFKSSLVFGFVLCLLVCLVTSHKSEKVEEDGATETRSVSEHSQSQDSSKIEAQYQEKKKDDTIHDIPNTVDERCPSVSQIAKRRQSIFKHLITRWRKAIETQQPWDQWSRKIIKCSLGRSLYKALGPESKIHMTENIRAILVRELKLRQNQMALGERRKNPCHPFLAERGKLKAILKFRASMVLARKPIVYLYPETKMAVNVSVDLTDGDFTTLYPKMSVRKQWEVEAKPCGSLTDLTTGRQYSYLFWEAKRASFSLRDGQCIKREDTETFLEKSLVTLGLNDKERNDFIVYWLPELEKNSFNLISFSTEEYNQWADLKVQPTPKSVVRVFMTFSPLKKEIQTPKVALPAPPPRTGFTVVEWGGAFVPNK